MFRIHAEGADLFAPTFAFEQAITQQSCKIKIYRFYRRSHAQNLRPDPFDEEHQRRRDGIQPQQVKTKPPATNA